MRIKLGYGLAPRCLIEEKLTVRFMYRESPDNEHDSGWRFFSGDETDEYVNIPENIGIYDLKTIAEVDPDIIPLLVSPIGSVFERDSKQAPFVIVPADEFTP